MAEAGWMDAEGQQFADIVRRHQSMVFSLALHLLHDPMMAEEVAQDVFLQLHKHLSELESADHVCFWLRRVTVHRAIDTSRRRHRTASLEDVPDPAVTPGEADPWLSERLRRLVASLPEPLRAAVVLRYQEDLDPADIAVLTDTPVATVKSHLQRGLSLLRNKLAGALKESGQ